MIERMKPKIKALWVAALRSGKYVQCNGRLHLEGDGYCCLGVLRELSGLATWEKRAMTFGNTMVFDNEANILPLSVRQWAGITSRTGIYHHDLIRDDYLTLASANDGGKSFAEIADIIEHEPTGLLI